MFSNSLQEISAKDELLNMNDEGEGASNHYDNLLEDFNDNAQQKQKSQQKININQDGSIYNNIKVLNNTLNFGQERGTATDKKPKKETPPQNLQENSNNVVVKKVNINGSNSKTVDNQRRKVIKPDVFNNNLGTNKEFKLSASCTRGSIKPSINLQEGSIIQQEEQNSQSDNTALFLKSTQNQLINLQKKELTKNNDGDEDELTVCLSQVYQKREKVVLQGNKDSLRKQIRERKPLLNELQLNYNFQNGSIDRNNNSINLGVKQTPVNIYSTNKSSSVKSSQRQLCIEPYSSKKIEDQGEYDGDKKRMQLLSGKKQSLDGSILFPTINSANKKPQQLFSSLIQQSDQKENQPFIYNSQISNSSKRINEYSLSQSQVMDYDSKLRRLDSFQQSRERWIDKLESDYINLLSKNIKGQRGYTVETFKNDQSKTNDTEMEIQLQNTILHPALKESFIDGNSSLILENEIIKQQTQLADPQSYMKSKDKYQKQQILSQTKDPTPQRNSRKGTQLAPRRKSIQILKKFDPNVVSIDMIRSEFKQDPIPESVQKYFESKQMKIYKQYPQLQNGQKSPIERKINTDNKQEEYQEFDDSSMIFRNQEIINRMNNSQDQQLNNSQISNTKNILLDAQNQSTRHSPSLDQRFAQSPLPLKEQNNNSLPYQQGSLFYNYLEYKQFKSKLEYEKEQRRREKIKKAKLRNKSPLQGMAQQEDLISDQEKRKDLSQQGQSQNLNQGSIEGYGNSVTCNPQEFYSQNQEVQSQNYSNQQKKKSININTNFFQLNSGFIPPFRLPQSTNSNRTEKKKVKLNQFSQDYKIFSDLPLSPKGSNNNSNINSNNYHNCHIPSTNQNKLPLISKKYLF